MRKNLASSTTACLILILLIKLSPSLNAATIFTNPKFSEKLVANGLDPTQMDIAPDGRIFVCSKTGALRVIKEGKLLAKPFVTIAVNSGNEQGLLGVAFHPSFPDTPWVYVYYTQPGVRRDRVSRFVASGDTALGGETVVIDLDLLSDASNHLSGAIHFGNDGKLYVSSGNNADGNNSQNINTTLGKMLRLNSDGSIPGDNPFLDKTTGNARGNWTTGMRNTFTFAVDKVTGKIFGCEVGDTWEEINELIGGSNYGYGKQEGYDAPASLTGMVGVFRPAIYAWSTPHGVVLGAAFYPPSGARMFPAKYHRSFFFSDANNGKIQITDIASPKNVTDFASNAASVIDIKFAADGSMYYVQRANGDALMHVVYDTTLAASNRIPTGKSHFAVSWRTALVQQGRLSWLAGASAIEVKDFQGRMVFSANRSQGNEDWVDLPSNSKDGLYFVNYR